MEYRIYEKIQKAFGESTLNNNKFKKALDSIKWDCTFFADVEYYFLIGKLTITTPSLNPFVEMDWKPCAFFSGENSYLEF